MIGICGYFFLRRATSSRVGAITQLRNASPDSNPAQLSKICTFSAPASICAQDMFRSHRSGAIRSVSREAEVVSAPNFWLGQNHHGCCRRSCNRRQSRAHRRSQSVLFFPAITFLTRRIVSKTGAFYLYQMKVFPTTLSSLTSCKTEALAFFKLQIEPNAIGTRNIGKYNGGIQLNRRIGCKDILGRQFWR